MQQQNSFPYNIIDGFAGEFTDTYCSRMEIPQEFMYISFLTCLGSLLARSITISTQIRPQPRLFVLLLGESADERKSTAIDQTIKFFDYALAPDEGEAKIPKKERTPEEEKSALSLQLQTCLGAGSAEGLAKRLQNSNLLLCYDEFKSFISKAKIRNSTLLSCVNTLFESNKYENQTGKAKIVIKNGRLSLLAASTIQTYEAAWDKSFTAIGFNNRLFIVPGGAERQHSLPPKIPARTLQKMAGGLYKILDFVGVFRELEITPNAKRLYHEWYMNRPASTHSKRLDGYALRFMELFAANRMADVIDESIVNNAIELMDWQFETRRLYDPIDADNEKAKMEEKIRRALITQGKELTDRGLKQATNANRAGLWIYKMGIKNLRDSGEISYNKRTRLWKAAKQTGA